jgi:hypothetical protein
MVVGFCACQLKPATTSPASSAFLSSSKVDLSVRSKRLPFQHAWRDPKIDMARYQHIVVRPVTTAFLRTELWEKSKGSEIVSKRAYLKRCNQLAKQWTLSLTKAFTSPICVFYLTKDTSKPGTLVLEVALTEVQFAPDSETSSMADSLMRLPVCAFEARVTDAASGKLIATVADRRGPDFLLKPSLQPSFTQATEAIFAEWSEQLMQASNKELFPTVRRRWFSGY